MTYEIIKVANGFVVRMGRTQPGEVIYLPEMYVFSTFGAVSSFLRRKFLDTP